jgi:hypothetical protein
MTSGLLDAVFAHLHISHPDEIEKLKAKVSVAPLSGHWRNIGLNVTLKAHIMEIHVCNLNEKWGIGEKEESFIEKGHQVGIKKDHRYAGLTNFQKKTASNLKTRANLTHPLVVACKNKVIEHSKKKLSPTIEPEGVQENFKRMKKEQVKVEKDIKRGHYINSYVSNNKTEN